VPDAFRLYVGDWLAYEWRFDVVRLWEIDAEGALRSGEAGPLALVPLLRGGDLQCAKLPDGAFVTLVTGKPPVRVARSRATRPSQRSAKRR
jgi:hypothetical protein